MSWDNLDLNKEQSHESKVKAAEAMALAKAYKRLFETEDGQKVLNDLSQKFIYNNNTSLDAINPNYEAAYHNGEKGVVVYCHSMKAQAETVRDD